MILMPQIFDVTANENARYKRNELEFKFILVLIRDIFSKLNEFATSYHFGIV